MMTGSIRPSDFDDYWNALDDELATYPMAAEERHVPRRDNEFSTAYEVRLTSIGPYRIFGHLTIPRGEGLFPALINMPRYGSVNNPPHWDDRRRYVCLSLMHRGQRLADQPFAATYPGLLTIGIDDPQTYIYRSIVADCLRGLEYLLSRPEIDPTRVGVVGDDLALISASRRPNSVSAVQVTSLMFHRIGDARLRTDAYPIEEINDELRHAPARESAVLRTLSYLDPVNHGTIGSGLLNVVVNDDSFIGGPEWVAGLLGQLGGGASTYQLTHEGGTDHDALDRWLATALGASPLPRLWEVTE
jgi:cephalosporin-C deacetylase-like acetyl esterase